MNNDATIKNSTSHYIITIAYSSYFESVEKHLQNKIKINVTVHKKEKCKQKKWNFNLSFLFSLPHHCHIFTSAAPGTLSTNEKFQLVFSGKKIEWMKFSGSRKSSKCKYISAGHLK